ncbi:unnamed protein product [Brassica rapa]|uniref:Uncharacterized protein n=1 Tax=Brassica campestris TaxID=3711 RepID=A0A3P5YJ42_BRACM|nr:unnamed protein product [Brassica rapa]VDC61393.1 unnamed protein product [Brassica rapa]
MESSSGSSRKERSSSGGGKKMERSSDGGLSRGEEESVGGAAPLLSMMSTRRLKHGRSTLFYTSPPRLARAASLVNGLSSTSSTGVEAVSNDDPLVGAHRKLIGEVFFLRSQVQNMMTRRDLLIQQVKASSRWELMKQWLEKQVGHWDPEEEHRRHLFLSGSLPRDLLWGRDFWRSLLSE